MRHLKLCDGEHVKRFADNIDHGGNRPNPGDGGPGGGGGIIVGCGQTICYDGNGNLISYRGWSYTYDAQNRLTSATNGTTTATFYYDGKNRQIARNIKGVVRFNAWDGWELVEEYSAGVSVATGYLQGSTGVIKSWSGMGTVYYYQDKLGSTTHVANASGTLVESYKYDLYGAPSYFNSTSQPINSSTVGTADLYAGERWIPELELYDLRNRFMSPELGRFLQADPIGFKGDASNLYRYCGNDPVDRSDPTGLSDLNYVPEWDSNNHLGADLMRYLYTGFHGGKIIVSAHGTTDYIMNSNMSRAAWNAFNSPRHVAIPESMRLSIGQLANDIKGLKKYTPTMRIKLDICQAGDFRGVSPAQAQQLANVLRTNPVTANTGLVNSYDGRGQGTDIRGGASREGTLGAGNSVGGRRAFDAFGSTTLEAARWENSYGYGGWFQIEKNLGR